jgi:hypothetical protein
MAEMKEILRKLLRSVFVLVLFTSCSHKIYDTLDWQGTKVTADGKIQEWPDPLRFFDEKSKLNYSISNDRQNLYIGMKISDEALKIKIIRGGMEFRVDTSGKKTFPIAFIFPVANDIVIVKHSANEAQPEKRYGGKSDHPGGNQKMLNHAEEFQLVGFKPPLEGTKSLIDNTTGISAAVSIDNLGIMNYEAIIPFKTFYKNELTYADTNTVFFYEIRIKALSAPTAHEGGGGSDRGMGGGGMGGGMGGGHHGGGGGQGGGMGGGGSHGGQHRNYSESASGNSDLYVANKITKKMRFSVK